MAVNAATVETYDNTVIREDLSEAYTMISPEETPFQTTAGTSENATSTLHEWPVLSLPAIDLTNRVIEGEDAPGINTGILPVRLNNYVQLSDKVSSVSSESEYVTAAGGNVQKLTKQIALQIRALKIDMEGMALQNIAASPGSSGNARVSAGFPAFLRTNTVAAAGGTDPTLSGTTAGYPNAAAGVGTAVTTFIEDDFNDLSQQIWENGGNPTICMVNATNKRIISETFTGASTRYKDAIDKTIVNAIDIYTGDFGEFTVVPNRFQPSLGNDGSSDPSYGVYMIDPDFVSIFFLMPMKQEMLAKTGHSNKRMVSCSWGIRVDNEAAHGVIRDTDGVMP